MIRRLSRLTLAVVSFAAAASPFLAAPDAFAQTVRPIPSSFRIPLGRSAPATISIVWRAVGGPTALSQGGSVVLDDPQQTVLEMLPPFPIQAGTNVSFSETIQLSASDLHVAALGGVRTIKVVRKFSFGGPPVIVAAIIQLSSPIGSDFAITRIQLRLGEGSPLRLVLRGSTVSAWADVSYAGTGELQALWELAEPASSAGVPVYRPVRRIYRPIGSGGRVSLPAPELPTDQTGLHLVRLRILDPLPSFEVPTLRYYVAPEGQSPPEPVAMAVGEPAHLASLGPDTVFTWRRVAGATAYRIEFRPGEGAARERHVHFDPENPTYADVGRASDLVGPYESGQVAPPPVPEVAAQVLEEPPMTGVLVGSEERSMRLGPGTVRHLAPGGTYVWVVRALGVGGIPIAVSPPRLIRVPE